MSRLVKMVFGNLIKISAPWFAAEAVGVCLAFFPSSARAASPAIAITNMPAYGAKGDLSGYVTNADLATNCVVVFIFVDGDWYTKPGCVNQLTPIQPNGAWTANITPNSNDVDATEIAAFLVPTNYDLACVNGQEGLTIPAQAEAVVYAVRVAPVTPQFNFSGYGWFRRAPGLQGPGPNYYSDSTNNIWVDAQGFLHLAITYTNGQWQCAEIISDRSFGYGQYRFTVVSPVDSLDPSVVLGMFTWSYDTAYSDREIDIELSRWNYQFGSNNVEDYAVAPYAAGQFLRFPLPASVTNSTHSFIWQPTNIAFQSLNGDFASPPASSNILESWNCAIGTPPAGGEQVQINLWLNKGNAPVYGKPVEVILSEFEFVPLGTPQPARLGPLTTNLPAGEVQLAVQGAMDWHYNMLSSSNLLNWVTIGTNIIATNDLFNFVDTNPLSWRSRFYETLTEP